MVPSHERGLHYESHNPSGASDERPLVDLEIKLGIRWQSTTASIEERSQMSYPVHMGRDVLRGDHVDSEQQVAEE